MKVVGVIPCRYQSSRFPGKPLELIAEKPMMWHVYQRAIEANIFDEIVLATDDDRIAIEAKRLGLDFLLTGKHHQTGTDRLTEVSTKINADIYVNLQGDEPLMPPGNIRAVTLGMLNNNDPKVLAVNSYSKILDESDVVSPNVVKVVFDTRFHALAYSRLAIPYAQSSFQPTYYKQHGLYAFNRDGIELFMNKSPGPIERSEQVELFRILEHNFKVLMTETESNPVSVDTPNDLKIAREVMES